MGIFMPMRHAGRHTQNKLRKYRKITGYSQTEVAKLLDLKHTNRISRWEKGVSMPSAVNLLKLSVLYEALADQLYTNLRNEFKQTLTLRKRELFANR
jgi:transcriptional regulator with XRE-family HTH domain